MDGRWRIELLGGLRVSRGEWTLSRFRSQRTAALLAYLAYFADRDHPRMVLAEQFWPEGDPGLGRHNLNVALSWLREHLSVPEGASPPLISTRFAVRLDPSLATTDVSELKAALDAAPRVEGAARAASLAAAVALYRGPLLPGFTDEWVLLEQQRLDEQFFPAVRDLIAYYQTSGDGDRAIQCAVQAVGVDPLREEAHRELIRLYAAEGRLYEAQRQYTELERRLARDLDVTPDAETRSLMERLAARTANGSRPPIPTARASDRSVPPPQNEGAIGAPARFAIREPIGGAVPLGSPYYLLRPADEAFAAALARRDSIVLVKGPRQVGKTSLLARGVQEVRQSARVVVTDLEALNAGHLESAEALLLAFAQSIAEGLELDVAVAEVWQPRRGPNPSFRRFLRREILEHLEAPLVWVLDGIDRLFGLPWSGELFGLFRSWHNERALDPSGPWSRLTLAIAYATEAHLFIPDLNKSPFNVGTRLALDDFTPEQVADLNRRCGTPLASERERTRFYRLVGGHPWLVRVGLDALAGEGLGLETLESIADREDGVFGDHLQRMRAPLARDPELCDVLRGVLAGRPCPTPRSFYRLRSAGLIAGSAPESARPRCELYARYFRRHLG
jgi:DNA-binding SARP family transcriptional activator